MKRHGARFCSGGAARLLGGDEADYHVDDAGAAGAAAEVHAGAPDFVLQQLVQLPAQHFHQLSHLEKKKTGYQQLSLVRGLLFLYSGLLLVG